MLHQKSNYSETLPPFLVIGVGQYNVGKGFRSELALSPSVQLFSCRFKSIPLLLMQSGARVNYVGGEALLGISRIPAPICENVPPSHCNLSLTPS